MASKKTDYQTLSKELDNVLERLQQEDISIDDAVASYERGMELIDELQAYLTNAENKVQKIKADFTAKPEKS
jgi:exodeoxyribonuclease VII small subunit